MGGSLSGKTLGHYKILEHIGSGGMGDVYLAEDEVLRRKVALKVLPDEMARRPDHLARFRREAEAVAALSHPNIVTIFSVEEEDGVHFLTMELVDGRTLDKLIPEGGMPLLDLLSLAAPMADALAAAHEAGVVHRDIKPSNVMVDRKGRLRIMDFGLAKLEPSGTGTGSAAPTEAMTREGVQIGTIPYMAPEQVQGKRVDHRADTFSFGIVLYEMATGRRPFGGGSGPEVMSAIMRDDPAPVGELRPDAPRGLARVLSRCLEKDPAARYTSTADLRDDLARLRDEESMAARSGRPAEASGRGRFPWWTVGVGAFVVLLAAMSVMVWRSVSRAVDRPTASAPPAGRRVSQLTFGAELEEWPAWSPDGKTLVYSAEKDGFKKLFTRDLASGEIRQLTEGRADEVQATWSPRGDRIAFVRASREAGTLEPDDLFGNFFEGGDIWEIDLGTGEMSRMIENAFSPAWSPDGSRIAFEAGWAGPARIWIADERGRNARQITTDTSEAVEHVEPSWSPDGSRLVFRRREKSKSDIQIIDLASAEVVVLTDDDYRDLNARWAPDGGSIIFSSYRGGGQNVWRQPVDGAGRPSAPAEQLTTGAGNDVQIALSPDGTRLCFTVLGINSDLWTLPVDARTGQPAGQPAPLVSTTREDSRGNWSPDGKVLAFNSDRLGDMNIWLRDLGDGAERQVTKGPGGDYQPSWSPDGARIVFFSSRAGNVDIWDVEVATGRVRQLTTSTSLDEDPFYSPDGRNIAFQSDRDGRLEVWVMNADGSDQRQLSHIGTSGHFMRWAPDSSAVVHRGLGLQGTNLVLQPLDGSPPAPLPEITGGGHHVSYSPDRSLIMDVTGHKTLWTFPVDGGERRKVFEFEDPDIRIDYPVWSPDGKAVVFDHAGYQGADIWLLEGLR